MVACGLQIQPIAFKGKVKEKKAVDVRCHVRGCVYVRTCTHVTVHGLGVGRNRSLLDGDGECLWKLLK